MDKSKWFIVFLLCFLNIIVDANFIALNMIYLFVVFLLKLINVNIKFDNVVNVYLILFFMGCVIKVWLRL